MWAASRRRCSTSCATRHQDLLEDIRVNDRKVAGELADKIKAVIEGVKKGFA